MCTSNGNHNHSTPIGAILNLDLMDGNQQMAAANQVRFDAAGVRCLNLMSSPGTGKTTLLESTLGALDVNVRPAVLEGDMTTELDADRLRAYGVPVVAITTGRACHLDAEMVAAGLDRLDLAALDLVFIENVGNLICPAEYPLGEHANVVLVSLTEGEDKPLKYPVMFYEADCVVITKTDLGPYLKVNIEQLKANIRQICPNVPVFALSAETGEGLPDWLDWIQNQLTTPVMFRPDEPVIVS
ncbi:MAG: hydrogenase nickel incorporation protein HypB [Anaerolineales bacterium]|nr:hydrogenase nickel incorporation protein HypB [Anaerolineales bacterium]